MVSVAPLCPKQTLPSLLLQSAQILADMFFAMRMQGIVLACSLCFSSLVCAVMTFQATGVARGFAFGLGLILFLALFAHVFSQLRVKLPQLPAASMKPLYTAMVRQYSVGAYVRLALCTVALEFAGYVLRHVAVISYSLDIWTCRDGCDSIHLL